MILDELKDLKPAISIYLSDTNTHTLILLFSFFPFLPHHLCPFLCLQILNPFPFGVSKFHCMPRISYHADKDRGTSTSLLIFSNSSDHQTTKPLNHQTNIQPSTSVGDLPAWSFNPFLLLPARNTTTTTNSPSFTLSQSYNLAQPQPHPRAPVSQPAQWPTSSLLCPQR